LSQLRRRVDGPTTGVGDAQLLQRFVGQHDEAAFELLVRRHERMVLGVCRRLLRREQDAEDAFQATFLALACKAGSISKHTAVGSWLYKVAYRAALRLRTNAALCLRHEQKAGQRLTAETASEEVDWDLCDLLHQEVDRLPEKYRSPVVLCYLEGRTNEEAAMQLRCPTGTVVTRLARARQRLRNRLARHSPLLSAATVSAFLSQGDRWGAVPAALRDLTVQAAGQFALVPEAAGLVSAPVASLTRGVLRAMMLTRIKWVAVGLLALGLLGAGSGVLAVRTPTWDDPPVRGQAADRSVTVLVSQGAQDKTPPATETKKLSNPSAPKKKKPEETLQRQTLTEVSRKTFKTGAAPHVVVQLYNGGIEIKATAEGRVQATVTKRAQAETKAAAETAIKGVDVKMLQDGDQVRIEARDTQPKHEDNTSSGASAEVLVPTGAVLELRTQNGPVKLEGGKGTVRVETSNGSIRAANSHGDMTLVTQNGPIQVTGATGKLELKTNNGRIVVAADKAAVTAKTTNGKIRFEGTLRKGSHALHTSNGSIEVIAPATASFEIDAETTQGRIRNAFTNEDAHGRGRLRLQTKIGVHPEAVLKLRTSNGSITIQPAETKAQAPLTSVPLILVEDIPYLDVRVNGSESLCFCIDSGASGCVLDRALCEKLGIATAGQAKGTGAGAGTYDVTFAKDVKFTVGTLTTKVDKVLVIDLSGVAAPRGKKLNGLLGYDYFLQYIIGLDYQRAVLSVHDPQSFAYHGSGEILPLTLKRKIPWVKGKLLVAGQKLAEREWLVDTGSGDALNDDLLAATTGNKQQVTGGRGLGKEFPVLLAAADRVELGRFQFRNVSGVSGGMKIGGGLLQHFTVWLDYNAKQMILEPNSRLSK
jgi:RNA polymerase sigma factor (sigma-70 family)